GHLEAYASGPAIAERYRVLTGRDGLCDLRSIAAEARAGDPTARSIIAEGASILGLALGGMLGVVDTQALIVGGGVAELGEQAVGLAPERVEGHPPRCRLATRRHARRASVRPQNRCAPGRCRAVGPGPSRRSRSRTWCAGDDRHAA
ncbi:MAG: ROK family protein, partial [Actinobacteria bacterium]|nr:ROK family protein [Actinomycetota bacterium]